MATSQPFPKKSVRSSIISHLPSRLFAALFVLIGFATGAQATLVNFQWNASTGPVAGYKLYRGLASGQYTASVQLQGTGTTGSMDLDPASSWYVAATAYDSSNQESAYSNEILCHPITASAGTGGTISPNGTFFAQQGSNVTFTLTPNSGFRVSSLIINGSSVGNVTSYTLSGFSGKVTVSAVFEPVPPTTYTITVTPPTNGSIYPSGVVSVAAGGSKTFTIAANDGYHIQDVIATDVSKGPVASYTFENVNGNQKLSAIFAINTYTITATAGPNGSIFPSSVTVNHGSSQTFKITPYSGYDVEQVYVDGEPKGAVESYTISPVIKAHTLTAQFVKKPNQPPVANAGPDQTVSEGGTITLSGAASMDPDDGIASYRWVQLEGPQVVLSDATASSPTFQSPNVGPEGASLKFQLTVTDRAGLSSVDTCLVRVTWINQPPVANAGPSQTVPEGTIVQLDGSASTDPDDGIVAYAWVQKGGPTVTLTNAKTAVASFMPPNVGLGGTSLTFELTVTDKGGLSATAQTIVNVTWVNAPPVANAGPDKAAYEGEVVILDGSASSDPDDGIVAYEWTQEDGSPVVFESETTSPQLAFRAPIVGESGGVFTFKLTVTDASGLRSSDTCTVSVSVAQGPDLTAGWTALSYKSGRITGSLTVRNVGNQLAGSNYIAFYLSTDGKTLDKYITRKSITATAAGQSKTLTFTYSKTGLSGQYIVAVADYLDRVKELKEDNNHGSVVIPTMLKK